jgi:hypothetical protein
MNAESLIVLAVTAMAIFPLLALARRGRGAAGIAFAILIVAGVSVSAWITAGDRRIAREREAPMDRPIELPEGDYVSSESCRSCHPGEYDSWHHSFHRTMTQEITPDAVRGDFSNLTVELSNGTYRFGRTGEDFWVEMAAYNEMGNPIPGGERRRRNIVLMTGSHHMQVYWLASGFTRKLETVPAVWLIEEQKWVPRLATFLVPPSSMASTETGRWNDSCIRCHTTQGKPGMRNLAEMDTTVAEFGIACEACHGPGEEHIRAHSRPLSRYGAHLGDSSDATTVHPLKLATPKNSMVCGQCHSVNIEKTDALMEDYLAHGATFRPGGDFSETREVVQATKRDETVTSFTKNDAYIESLFWSDGMVRVSGREYNGLIDSPCFKHGEEKSKMSCFSCHVMHKAKNDGRTHEEWRDDQLNVGMRTNEACLQCHEEVGKDLTAHTRHAVGSSGSLCYNCHMPYTTYGLLKAIRSHQVDSPSVHASLTTGRPNACNQCHLDKTMEWAGKELAEGWGMDVPRLSEEQRSVAASVLWAVKGDAGQRALMAWSMGWDEARQVSGEEWQPVILSQLLADPYPAVRFIAARSLRRLKGFGDLEYDPDWELEKLREAAQATASRWSKVHKQAGGKADLATLIASPGKLDQARFEALLQKRNEKRVVLNE